MAQHFVCVKPTIEPNLKETSKNPTSPQAAPNTPILTSNIPIVPS